MPYPTVRHRLEYKRVQSLDVFKRQTVTGTKQHLQINEQAGKDVVKGRMIIGEQLIRAEIRKMPELTQVFDIAEVAGINQIIGQSGEVAFVMLAVDHAGADYIIASQNYAPGNQKKYLIVCRETAILNHKKAACQIKEQDHNEHAGLIFMG